MCVYMIYIIYLELIFFISNFSEKLQRTFTYPFTQIRQLHTFSPIYFIILSLCIYIYILMCALLYIFEYTLKYILY